MKRRRNNQIKPTMATHFPSLSRGTDLNQNIHMFTQDIQVAVMPIRGRAEKHKEFTVTLTGDQGECEKAEQLIGDIARYNRHDLTEIVCDAVEEIARNLAWEGSAEYEIVSGDVGVQHLCGFTSKGLWKLPGYFIQIIPRGDWELYKRQFSIVSVNKVWHIEMPSALGGRRGYKAILRRLKRFKHLGPEFWRKDTERGVQSRDFDFQHYVRNSEIYYSLVTKIWGWNRRDWSQERCTEFFNFYKFIRFSWAKAVLREHIIRELNGLLKKLAIKCKLSITGLPTPDYILQINSELLEGKISFGAASERVSL